MTIAVFTFCPFWDRAGGAAIGIRFAHHDEELLTALKLALVQERVAVANPDHDIRRAGGYLPHADCWYVELGAWPGIRAALRGHDPSLRFSVVGCPDDVQQFAVHGVAP